MNLRRSIFSLILLTSSVIAQASPNLSKSDFNYNVYKPMDLTRECRSKYGSSFNAVSSGDHAYNWGCSNGIATYGINAGAVCRAQWGSQYKAVLNGNHKYDWSCTNWDEANYHVVPVVIMASEFFFDVNATNEGISTVANIAKNTRDWYGENMALGKTFSLARPVVHLSLKGRDAWHDYSCLTAQPNERVGQGCTDLASAADRGKLFWEMVNEVKYLFNNKSESSNLVASIFVYTGGASSAPFWFGAAALGVDGVEYNVQPPSSVACVSEDEDCGVYALGHEAGHNFGLGHACDGDNAPANCGLSIMQNPSLIFDRAILLQSEQDFLDNSLYFK